MKTHLVLLLICVGCSASTTRRDRLLAVNADVVVLANQTPFIEYREVTKQARAFATVRASAPFTFAELVASWSMNHAMLAVKGIDASRHGRLAPYVTAGSLDGLEASHGVPGIALGDDIARTFHLAVGDELDLQLPFVQGDHKPEPQRFRVAAIIDFGHGEYDRKLAVASLSAVQRVLGRGDVVMGIELDLVDPLFAGQTAKRLQLQLGPTYDVRGWHQLLEL